MERLARVEAEVCAELIPRLPYLRRLGGPLFQSDNTSLLLLAYLRRCQLQRDMDAIHKRRAATDLVNR